MDHEEKENLEIQQDEEIKIEKINPEDVQYFNESFENVSQIQKDDKQNINLYIAVEQTSRENIKSLINHLAIEIRNFLHETKPNKIKLIAFDDNIEIQCINAPDQFYIPSFTNKKSSNKPPNINLLFEKLYQILKRSEEGEKNYILVIMESLKNTKEVDKIKNYPLKNSTFFVIGIDKTLKFFQCLTQKLNGFFSSPESMTDYFEVIQDKSGIRSALNNFQQEIQNEQNQKGQKNNDYQFSYQKPLQMKQEMQKPQKEVMSEKKDDLIASQKKILMERYESLLKEFTNKKNQKEQSIKEKDEQLQVLRQQQQQKKDIQELYSSSLNSQIQIPVTIKLPNIQMQELNKTAFYIQNYITQLNSLNVISKTQKQNIQELTTLYLSDYTWDAFNVKLQGMIISLS